jgi:hypothetical protein
MVTAYDSNHKGGKTSGGVQTIPCTAFLCFLPHTRKECAPSPSDEVQQDMCTVASVDGCLRLSVEFLQGFVM